MTEWTDKEFNEFKEHMEKYYPEIRKGTNGAPTWFVWDHPELLKKYNLDKSIKYASQNKSMEQIK
jgi:hypothetical protein